MNPVLTFVLVILAVSAVPMLFILIRKYLHYRKARVLICPETRKSATVKLEAGRAARSAVFDEPVLRVRSCSLGHVKCSQGCVEQFDVQSFDTAATTPAR